MTNKSILITVICIGSMLPFSCNQEPSLVRLTSLDMAVGQATVDFRGDIDFTEDVDSLSFESNTFGLKLSIATYERVASLNFRNPMMSYAFADDPGSILESNIDFISIKANTAFTMSGDNYLIGDELNGLFVFGFNGRGSQGHNGFIEVSQEWQTWYNLFMKFDSQIDAAIETVFTVVVILDNGQTFTLTSDTVKLY
jgi:hypothetical protein